MNEISIIYYGELKDVGEHLLFILKVLNVKPANSEYSGFYISEKKFGFESHRKVSLTLKDSEDEAQDYLIYRYLTASELEFVNSSKVGAKFNILLHKHFNAEYIKNNIQIESTQTNIIVDYARTSNIQNYHYAKKYWPSTSLAKISTQNVEVKKEPLLNITNNLPVIVLFLMKVIFNPINELKHYALMLKYSNLRVFSRLIELFIFLDFIFKAVIVKLIKQAYYKLNFLIGLLKVLLIKCIFGIRHILLICGFKSFGLFVDFFNFVVRIKDALVNLFVYKFWHYLLFRVGYFLYYKVGYFLYYKVGYSLHYIFYFKMGHFLYYKVGYFLYYRVGYFLYYRVLHYLAVNILFLGTLNAFYILRHTLRMTFFKIYGFGYDLTMLSYRFVKLVLLYPLRKVYWFASFQYNKRIKKYFKNEA